MKFSSLLCWLSAGIFCAASPGAAASPVEALNQTPEQAMVELSEEICSYAKEKQPDFQLVGNGALGLLEVTKTETQEAVDKLVGSLDGFLAESVFFTGNGEKTAEQDPKVLTYIDAMLEKPKTAGKAVWTLDYVPEQKRKKVEALGGERGYISMTSARSSLDGIPEGTVPDKNDRDVRGVAQAENFLILLNPGGFESRSAYLEALAETPYDVLILDLYYGSEPLTREEVRKLQAKPQGGRRLILAYMSVGEAADYRTYWQTEWNDPGSRPSWIARSNPNWPGAYRVRYWEKPWQRILYGSDEAYLDEILHAGFDGAFLDVLDAWQTFR